jgi:hypothetical protein
MKHLTIAIALTWSGVTTASVTEATKVPAHKALTAPAGAFKWDGRMPAKQRQLHWDNGPRRNDGHQ